MNTWTTKDGQELLITEMETSHIKNCINLLLNNPNFFDEGGMSMFDPSDCYYESNEHIVDEYIEAFEKELKTRIKERK